MQIEVSYEQGQVPVTVFHVKGNIAIESYEQLQKQAQEAIEVGTRNLLLDLTGVDYVSSSGLRAIHRLYNLLQDASPEGSDEDVRKGIGGGTFTSSHLKLLNPSPEVTNVLKMAGFDMFLETHSNLQDAIASF